MKIPTIKQICLAIGYATPKDWPGACGVICYHIIEKELVEGGEVLQGFWMGPTNYNPEYTDIWLSDYYKRQKFPQHCWIRFGNNKILDATRWVFEGVKPYIYYGDNDHYQIS
jgi:hypothetical protein